MPENIQREDKSVDPVVIDTVLADATAVDEFATYAGGILYIPAGATTQTVTIYARDPDGTYLALYDKDGTAVTLSVQASRAYELPAACFGARSLKFVAGTADITAAMTLKG